MILSHQYIDVSKTTVLIRRMLPIILLINTKKLICTSSSKNLMCEPDEDCEKTNKGYLDSNFYIVMILEFLEVSVSQEIQRCQQTTRRQEDRGKHTLTPHCWPPVPTRHFYCIDPLSCGTLLKQYENG